MISRLSEATVRTLYTHGEISPEDKELYTYGFFMLFSRVFFFLLTLTYGALFGIAAESALFYVLFIVIRGYAGGIHAAKESTCTICTSLSLLLSVAAMRLFRDFALAVLPLIFLLLSALCILILCPLDTAAKRLTEAEKKEYRKKTWSFTLLILLLAIPALFLGIPWIFYPCAVSLSLESILLIIGKLAEMKHTCFR